MADERKYVIDLEALRRFKRDLDKTGMMSVEPTEFDFENDPSIELRSDDLAAIIENRPGKLMMNIGHNSDVATLAFDLALAVGENGGATLIYTGKIFDGEEDKVFNVIFFASRDSKGDDCAVEVYEEGGGGGSDDPAHKQIWTYNGTLGPGTTDETIIAGDTYGFQWFEYSPKDKTYYYYSDTTTLTEIPNDLSVNWDGTVYNIPYASSADESRYYGEFVDDEFEFGNYPCGIVLTDNGGGDFEIMVFTDSSADNHYVEVLGQISDPSHLVLTFSNNESYYNVYNAIEDGHTLVLKIYSSVTGDTIWLPVCEKTGFDQYYFYGYHGDNGVKVSISRSDEYHWVYNETPAESPNGYSIYYDGGSLSVSYSQILSTLNANKAVYLRISESGNVDYVLLHHAHYTGSSIVLYGEKWSSNTITKYIVTIDNTDSISVGSTNYVMTISGSEEYATNSDIDDIFEPPTPPQPTVYTVSSSVSSGISASSIPPTINEGDTLYVTWSVDSGYSFLMSYVTMGGVDVTSQYATNSSIVIPNVTGDIYLEITAQSDSPGNTHSISYDTMNFNCVFDGYNYPPSSIEDGASLSGHLEYDPSYNLQSFQIEMGGVDITEDVFDWGTEEFTINNVTGDIEFSGYAEEEYVETWPIYYIFNGVTVEGDMPSEVEEGDSLDMDVRPFAYGNTFQAVGFYRASANITNNSGVWTDNGDGSFHIHIENIWDDITLILAAGNGSESFQLTNSIMGDGSWVSGYVPSSPVGIGMTPTYKFRVDDVATDWVSIVEVYMGNTNITDIAWIGEDGSNNCIITLPPVAGEVTINIEIETDEPDVPIESIRYTDGQGSTCIGFNMNEGSTCDLWDNLEVLPIDFTDGVEFISSDDAVIEVDGSGIVTAVGALGDGATITIRSMGDSSIYTTVSISISEDEPDEPDEPEEEYDFAFTNNCQDCWMSDEPFGFNSGDSWSTNVIPDSGYYLDGNPSVSITMGGVDITNTAWNAPGASGNGSIYIPNVTGDVDVTVIAEALNEPEVILPHYFITYNLTNVSNSNNATEIVGYNNSYSATLTPDTHYNIGTVEVLMGGTDITSTAYSNGSIYIANVTGDIEITATGEAAQSGEIDPGLPSFATMTYNLTGCDLSYKPAASNLYSSFSADVTPDNGYQVDVPDSVSVTMGGTDITNSAWTYPGASGIGHININSITGNVVITIVAGANK